MKDEYGQFKVRSSACRVAPVRRLFGNDDSNQLASRILRLAVLFQDLHLEAMAVSAPDGTMLRLDVPDEPYRKFYFMRRAFATLYEFEHALDLLQKLPDFGRIQARFDRSQASDWNAMTAFFQGIESC